MKVSVVEKQVGRPIVVFLLAVISVLLGYLALREKHPGLTYDITGESNVFNVQRSLPELSVLFQDQDIYGRGQNLRIITLRVANTGATDILQSHFDQTRPWGLQVDNGRIIEARLIGASSEYLQTDLQPTLSDDRTVIFRKVILERGQGVNLELLVLHQRQAEPQVVPIGKIAGIERFDVATSSQDVGERRWYQQAFDGELPIQVARLFAYAFLALIGVIAVGFAVAGATSLIDGLRRKRRRARVQRVLSSVRGDEEALEALADTYEAHSAPALLHLRALLAGESRLPRTPLNAAHVLARRRAHGIDDLMLVSADPSDPRETIVLHPRAPSFLVDLKERGVIAVSDNGTVSSSPDLRAALDDLIRLLGLGPARSS